MRIPLPDGMIDLPCREVHRGGACVLLTPTEQKLITYLVARAGTFVPLLELLREVWGFQSDVSLPTIKVATHRLRKKIEPHPQNPVVLLTRAGVGLSWQATVPLAETAQEPHEVPGRESDQRRLLSLAAKHPVVTITGIGGIGKTRLLQWWARACGEPSLMVSLEQASSLQDVEAAIRAAARLDSEASLDAWLASRAVSWLFLDNLEQLVPTLLPWLLQKHRRAPQLRWGLTSRTPLGLSIECLLELDELAPEAARSVFLEVLEQRGVPAPDPATLERALAFTGGWPLLLQWVATRARYVDWQRLTDEFAAANQPGPSVSQDRHASLQATLEGSWALMSPTDRASIQALTVFRAPFTSTDAVFALGLPTESLRNLVDHHWIHRSGHAWAFHPLVRAFVRQTEGAARQAQSAAERYIGPLLERIHRQGTTEDADDSVVRMLDLAEQYPELPHWNDILLDTVFHFHVAARGQTDLWVAVAERAHLPPAQRQKVLARAALNTGSGEHTRAWLERLAAGTVPTDPIDEPLITLALFAAQRFEHETGITVPGFDTWPAALEPLRQSGKWTSLNSQVRDFLVRFTSTEARLQWASTQQVVADVSAIVPPNPPDELQRVIGSLRWSVADLRGDRNVLPFALEQMRLGTPHLSIERLFRSALILDHVPLYDEAERRLNDAGDLPEGTERRIRRFRILGRVWFQHPEAAEALASLPEPTDRLGQQLSEFALGLHRITAQSDACIAFAEFLGSLAPSNQIYRALGRIRLAEVDPDAQNSERWAALAASDLSGLPPDHPLRRRLINRVSGGSR